MRRPQRHPCRSYRRCRAYVFTSRIAHSRYRHGRSNPRNRRLHHQGAWALSDMFEIEAIRMISRNLPDSCRRAFKRGCTRCNGCCTICCRNGILKRRSRPCPRNGSSSRFTLRHSPRCGKRTPAPPPSWNGTCLHVSTNILQSLKRWVSTSAT